ncbi:hypothetical protein HPP92_011379 [Vanilla planifolia]|uniref:DNA mismatch repair protein PMS1 n=1 Tax=Vanilla planifolia TaxID=51239 RepID=A0A835V2B6_VANPL|nr:hypothetical protein HPP92_011379 [Vanilla planifolia]
MPSVEEPFGQERLPVIKAISKVAVHRICSGQVILDLSSAVKELVENSLDAGASYIEISLKEYGEEFFKVIDNGCGISADNFQTLGRKHYTSKISDFSDLRCLTTFGFRGEALSSLCALGNLTIETRTKNDAVGTHLTFDHLGSVAAERKTARQVGTTVTVEKLFSTLPVRSKEFSRNIRREYGKLTSLLNAYALISQGVRILCTNINSKNSKSVLLKTQGSCSLKENIITVLGLSTFQCLDPLKVHFSECGTIEGYLSKPGYGSGRNMGDRQFFYINNRPVDMPKVSKLSNEVYKLSNSKQYPIAILNFSMPTTSCDVNVTPDKRKVYISDEASLLLTLRTEIEKFYSPHQCSYSISDIKKSFNEGGLAPLDNRVVDNSHGADSAPKSFSIEGDGQRATSGSTEQLTDDVSQNMLQVSNHDISMKRGFDCDDDGSPGKVIKPTVLENFHNYQFKLSTCITKPNATSVGKSPSSLRKNDLSCYSNHVQSSLSTLLAGHKRKHDNSVSMLSEMPLLRDGRTSCHEERRDCEMNVPATRTNFSVSEIDLSGSGSETPQLEHEDNHASCKVKSLYSAESGTFEIDSNKGNLGGFDAGFPVSDVVLEASPGTKLEICYEGLLKPTPIKSCSTNQTYPVLQFSIVDLKKRRDMRMSDFISANSTYDGRVQSCYSAATLANSKPENDNINADSLAAAIMEFERFFRKEDFGRMEVIGQFNLGFIIGKLDQDLFMVDQHAADEKYNFEHLSKTTVLNVQPLLKPIRLELSPEEEVVASLNMEIIRKNGFVLIEDINASPGHQYLLKAVPLSKNITFGIEDLKELISSLVDNEGECSINTYKMDTSDSICPSRVRAMLASRACRQSVMIGDPLTKYDMQKILDNLVDLNSPWNCPHGRPTMRHLLDLTTLRNKR